MDLVQVAPFVTDETLLTFRSRIVRDLVWAITLPPIVVPVWPPAPIDPGAGSTEGEPTVPTENPSPTVPMVPVMTDSRFWIEPEWFRRGWYRMESYLRTLDAEDAPLREYMAPYRRLRQGLQFERLLAFWFDKDPEIGLLETDRQVFSGDRTVGQIDFLLETGGERLQLEVAVKYYLRRQGRTRLDGYVGTDMKDRLDLKLAHMLFHQRHVRVPGYPHTDVRSALSLRGRIFEPLVSDRRRSVTDRPGLPVLPRSWWIARRDLRARAGSPLDPFHRYRWTLGDRDLWFSPVAADEAQWYEWSDIESIVETDGLPGVSPATMVIGRDSESPGGGETTRGFIVHI
ncbi:MAG: DUF1853 family protein [Alkalispirochaeta sp.]